MVTFEKQLYLIPKLIDAVKRKYWDTVEGIIVLNPEIDNRMGLVDTVVTHSGDDIYLIFKERSGN